MGLLEEFKLMQVNKNEVAQVGLLEGINSVCRFSLRTKGHPPPPQKKQQKKQNPKAQFSLLFILDQVPSGIFSG